MRSKYLYRREEHPNTHIILLGFNGGNLMNIYADCVYTNVSLNTLPLTNCQSVYMHVVSQWSPLW